MKPENIEGAEVKSLHAEVMIDGDIADITKNLLLAQSLVRQCRGQQPGLDTLTLYLHRSKGISLTTVGSDGQKFRTVTQDVKVHLPVTFYASAAGLSFVSGPEVFCIDWADTGYEGEQRRKAIEYIKSRNQQRLISMSEHMLDWLIEQEHEKRIAEQERAEQERKERERIQAERDRLARDLPGVIGRNIRWTPKLIAIYLRQNYGTGSERTVQRLMSDWLRENGKRPLPGQHVDLSDREANEYIKWHIGRPIRRRG